MNKWKRTTQKPETVREDSKKIKDTFLFYKWIFGDDIEQLKKHRQDQKEVKKHLRELKQITEETGSLGRPYADTLSLSEANDYLIIHIEYEIFFFFKYYNCGLVL